MKKGLKIGAVIIFVLFLTMMSEGADFGPTQPYDKLSSALVTPHIPWANPYYQGKLKVLVIAPMTSQRETVELAQRLSLDYTPLMTSRFDYFGSYKKDPHLREDYYGISAGEFTKLVDQRLGEEAKYDVIIIGKMDWKSFPNPIQQMILEKVKQGTGLLYVSPRNLPTEIQKVLKGRIDEGFISQGIPLSVIPLLKDIPEESLISSGVLQQGRVVVLDYNQKNIAAAHMYEWDSITPHGSDDPLFYDYYFSLLARACLWAAKKEPTIIFDSLKETVLLERSQLPGNISVALKGELRPGQNLQLISEIRNQNGEVEMRNAVSCGLGTFSIKIPLLPRGEKILNLWVKDRGKVINWYSVPLEITSPYKIKELSLNKSVYRRNEQIEGQLLLSQLPASDFSLVLEVWDNYNRKVLIIKPEVKGREAKFSFIVPYPLSSFYTLKALLKEKEAIAEEARTSFYLRFPERDLEDFSFIVWGDAWVKSRSVKTYLEQLNHIGVDTLYTYQSNWDSKKKSDEVVRRLARANLRMLPYSTRIVFRTSKGEEGLEIKEMEKSIDGCPLSDSTEKIKKNPQLRHLRENIAPSYGLFDSLYSLGDETQLSLLGGQDVCFCHECQESFRNYFKHVFSNNITALNEAWGTGYKDWQEVKPITLVNAYKQKCLPQWVAHRLHMEKLFIEYHKTCLEALREGDPKAKIGIEGNCPYGPFVGNDWAEMLPFFNFFAPYQDQGIPQHPASFSFMPENSLEATIFGSYPGMMDEDTMRYVPWYQLFQDMNASFWWILFFSAGLGGPAALSYDFLPLTHFKQASEEIEEIKQGIAKLLLSSEKVVDPIAVHFSNSNLYASVLRPKETTWLASLSDFHYALRESGYNYRYLGRKDVETGKLKDYKVLVLPYAQALSLTEVEEIKNFVSRGGILIADFSPGIMNEFGKLLPKSPLLELFGGKFEPLQVNNYGRGKAVYLGDLIKGYSNRRLVGDSSQKSGFLRLLEGISKISPLVKIEDNLGGGVSAVEASLFKKDNCFYLGLLMDHKIKKKESRTVLVKLPSTFHVYEVRTSSYLGYLKQFTTALIPGRAKLFALLPSKVESIKLKLNKFNYQKGDEVRCKVIIEPIGRRHNVVRIEVLAPDGKVLPYYSRNFLLEEKAEPAIHLSLNESPGVYKIVVKDIATGLSTTGSFRVE